MREGDGESQNYTADQRALTERVRDFRAGELTIVSNGLLKGVHSPEVCVNQPWGCWVHAPKPHALAAAPICWRGDTGTAERVCRHGVGHPDPQDVAYWWKVHGRDVAGHGCDGCCGEDPAWYAEVMG
jgi:hypothetical protein